jgi:putative acetyltransferase
MNCTIRPIAPADDAKIAEIIRTVMPEFGADGAGFAIHDAEVSEMSLAYQRPGAAYFVVEMDGQVLGGAGIAPLDGEAGVCELRKMYFLSQARGLGAGQAMMQRCLDFAASAGYQRVYLETLSGMDAAFKLYERNGFQRLPAARGNTGHFGCNRFYERDMSAVSPDRRDFSPL